MRFKASRVFVPAGTSKSMLRRHGIQAVTRVMAYIANAVTLSSTMCTGGFECTDVINLEMTASNTVWL
jgi:alkylhydroperoxidase/carboxymuconolactone decarboxylase family protein YurZ